MNKKIPEPRTENLWDIMRRSDAVFSLSIEGGFANIKMEKTYNDKENLVVKFYDEEGVSQEDMDVLANDVVKVGKFIQDLKAVRFEEWKKEV